MPTPLRRLGAPLLLVSAAALLWACAPAGPERMVSGSFVRTQKYRLVMKSGGDAVMLFTVTAPKRRFSEVGILTVRDWDYPRVVWFARDLAAKMGCDALIQIGIHKVVHEAYRTPLERVEARYHTIGRFTCILWARRS